MASSSQILSVVLCAAAAVGAGVWGANWKNRAEKLETQESSSPEVATLAALVEELSLSVGELSNQVEEMRGDLRSIQGFRPPTAELEAEVASTRALEWVEPPVWTPVDRTQLKAAVEAELQRVRTAEGWEQTAQAWMILGLLDEPYDLFSLETALRSLDNRAWYSAHDGQIYASSSVDGESPANRRLMVNALTANLVDGQLRAQNLPLYLESNDDAVLAARALAEGDSAWVAELMSSADELLLAGSPQPLAERDLRTLEAVPALLRARRQFPSVVGQNFVQLLYESAGESWELVNRAYQVPPSSTTEVLRPQLYLEGWKPVEIDWSVPLWQQGNLLADNVLGEFALGELFAQTTDTNTAFDAAQGWRGDRYQVYLAEEGAPVLLWQIHWQTGADAQQAFEAFVSHYEFFFGNEGEELEREEYLRVQVWSDGVSSLELLRVNEHTIQVVQTPEELRGQLRELLPEVEALEDQLLEAGQSAERVQTSSEPGQEIEESSEGEEE